MNLFFLLIILLAIPANAAYQAEWINKQIIGPTVSYDLILTDDAEILPVVRIGKNFHKNERDITAKFLSDEAAREIVLELERQPEEALRKRREVARQEVIEVDLKDEIETRILAKIQ